MKRKYPPAEFFRIVNGKPLAVSLLESYCIQSDPALLKDFYYQDDRRSDSGRLLYTESFHSESIADQASKVKIAQKYFSDDKDSAFEAKLVDEHQKLIQIQSQLERDTGYPFNRLTLTETISKCLQLGHVNRATKRKIEIKSDFKIPEKRFWWLRVKALVSTSNWEALEKYAKSNAKTHGYAGIIELLIKSGQKSQVNFYIDVLVRTGSAQDALLANKYVEISRTLRD